jgi:structural maintenance of chromosomes protein 6
MPLQFNFRCVLYTLSWILLICLLQSKKLRLSEATEDGSLESPSSRGSAASENTIQDVVVTDPEEQEEVEEEDAIVTDPDEDDNEDQQNIQPEREDYRELSDDAAMERVQNMRARRNNVQNHAADNAIIEEVSCTNFMCHAALSIQLGPLINFVIGHNGSGKSAVLTALTICLGGKASATNRGGSLKSFIKEGREKATLKVRIKNQGRSAYKPETFGASIIVERHFSRSGSSGFNLRNAQGKLISSSRRDVDDMLDYFALQLDNPMNVLTQDQARAFLNSSSAKDKYKFFNKGTQLETLDHDYQAMEESLTTIENYMGAISEQRINFKSKYELAKKDTERVVGQRKIQDEINRIRMQMCWVQVEDEERNLESCETSLRKVDDEILERQEEIDQADSSLTEAKSRHEAALSKHKKLKEEELDPLLDKKSELSATFKEKASDLQLLLTEKRTIHAHINSATTALRSLQQKIREEKEKLDNTDSRTAQIHLDLQNEKEKHEEAQQAMKELKSQLDRESDVFERLKGEESRAKNDYEQQNQKVKSCKERIQQIQQQGGRVSLQPQVKKLLDAINRSRNFRVKPLGPISEYVYLKEPKWSSILERTFGGSLNSFVVTSKEDANELTKLIKQFQVNAPVLIGHPRPIDTSRQEPPEKFLTWLRVLRINDDLIRNQLIINQSVEKSVLIEDREEAHGVLMNQQVSNIRQIFCFTDDQTGKNRGAGIRLNKTRVGSSTNPIQPWVGPQRMRSDIQAQLRFVH